MMRGIYNFFTLYKIAVRAICDICICIRFLYNYSYLLKMNLFVKTNIRFVINRNKLALWTKLSQTDITVIEIYT